MRFGYPWDRAPWSAIGAAIGLLVGLSLDIPHVRALLSRIQLGMKKGGYEKGGYEKKVGMKKRWV